MSAADQPEGRETDVEKVRNVDPRAADLVDGLVRLYGIEGAQAFLFSGLRYWKLEYQEDEPA